MSRGFTIIELLVSMAIIVVLATMVTIAFSYNQQHKVLVANGQQFLNVLKETQTKALAGLKNPATKIMPAGGYGVRISAAQYFVFADNNSNATLDIGETLLTNNLEKNIQFKVPQSDIVFLPYKTIDSVCWNTVCADAVVKIISLEQTQTKETHSIYLDQKIGKIWSE
ncbi:prepilin-type N-terminal cleavage/methylation domain-containing protein [Candidatus Falkowbacteria bacterium]|nr:prepilin-type N-terminal cleavage/methylation domain-containing protein [Candidatus Falkowbacteria bacterium]